ncbi:hypothetical protein [Klebsiella pneumoniae]|uniref:hypothetical protein n=1 Tax=Klebsiella pneumoniae TaxID=573 RepID=UPI0020CED99C|nr:hypothetical protein [Klebsiella pneumoniae]
MKGLITKLENVADLSVLQTDSGIDVAGIINGGGCCTSSARWTMSGDPVQKMLFARCAQIIIARDEFRRWPHASIMLDEIKYLLSKYVLNALGRCAAGTATCCSRTSRWATSVSAGRICPLIL